MKSSLTRLQVKRRSTSFEPGEILQRKMKLKRTVSFLHPCFEASLLHAALSVEEDFVVQNTERLKQYQRLLQSELILMDVEQVTRQQVFSDQQS